MRNLRRNIVLMLAFVLIASFVSGCAIRHRQTCEREGIVYCRTTGIFRSQWDDYYERALSCMEGQYYSEALADLAAAIRERPEDQRLARTYGMHFIDYFPHREIGLIHFLTGDYDAAKTELELSVSQEPSAKAYYYLDEARKAILMREKRAAGSPRLELKSPPFDEVWTREAVVRISGIAEDERFVSEIEIRANPEIQRTVFQESSKTRLAFDEAMTLPQGRYEFSITARNLLGGAVMKTVVVHVDRSGPVIVITSLDRYVRGYLRDDNGKVSLTANGKSVTIKNAFEFAIPVLDTASIELIAEDGLGNRTQASIEKDHLAHDRNSLRIVQLDGGVSLADTQKPSFSMKLPIRIDLKGWQKYEEVFVDRVPIEGDVTGLNPIVSLTLNDHPVLSGPGMRVYFNHMVELKPGENDIVVTASDETGHTVQENIRINRKIGRAFQLAYRYKISVCPLNDCIDGFGPIQTLIRSKTSPPEQEIFHSFFLHNLVKRKRFRIAAHERLKYTLPDEASGSPSQASLVGAFVETENGMDVTMRLIENRTSKILALADAYGVSKHRDALESMAEDLSERFHRSFPMIRSEVSRNNGRQLISGKTDDLPRMGWPLVFYRILAPRRNPVTGAFLGSDTEILGYGCVDELMLGGFGAIPTGLGNHGIRIGDWMVTQ